MEVLAGDYLIEKGYHIIHSGGVVIWNSRLRKKFTGSRGERWTEEEHKQFELLLAIWRKLSLHSYGYDYLCKKGNSYFVFEIKYKIWKKGREHFNSSEKQIRGYNKIQKQGKVKVKVLTIIEKDKKLFYKISNWDDFEKTKVSILKPAQIHVRFATANDVGNRFPGAAGHRPAERTMPGVEIQVRHR